MDRWLPDCPQHFSFCRWMVSTSSSPHRSQLLECSSDRVIVMVANWHVIISNADQQVPHISIQEKVGDRERNTRCRCGQLGTPSSLWRQQKTTGGTASDLDQLAKTGILDSPPSYSVQLVYLTRTRHKLNPTGEPKVNKPAMPRQSSK
jgi:hypothetical protein